MAATAPSSLFIDTGAFIALSFSDDSNHESAMRYYEPLPRTVKFVTTLLVVAETYTWLRYRVRYSTALSFLDGVDEALGRGTLVVVHSTPELHCKTLDVLRSFDDADLSYVDASSFVVIEDHGIHDVFTFDSHFHILRRNVWPISRES